MDDYILGVIKKIFADGCPNGHLLGWDKKRFQNQLSALIPNGKVANETSFDYSYCNSFEISFGEPEKEQFILTVKASFVANVFSAYLVRYSSDRRTGKIVDARQHPAFSELLDKISSFFSAEGFKDLSDSQLNEVIEGVSLELAEHATVGKCLFDDFE